MKIGVERMRDRAFVRLLVAPFGRQPGAAPPTKDAPNPARR
jgi:hypothetical protein